jgi:hypothetical protein
LRLMTTGLRAWAEALSFLRCRKRKKSRPPALPQKNQKTRAAE